MVIIVICIIKFMFFGFWVAWVQEEEDEQTLSLPYTSMMLGTMPIIYNSEGMFFFIVLLQMRELSYVLQVSWIL